MALRDRNAVSDQLPKLGPGCPSRLRRSYRDECFGAPAKGWPLHEARGEANSYVGAQISDGAPWRDTIRKPSAGDRTYLSSLLSRGEILVPEYYRTSELLASTC